MDALEKKKSAWLVVLANETMLQESVKALKKCELSRRERLEVWLSYEDGAFKTFIFALGVLLGALLGGWCITASG